MRLNSFEKRRKIVRYAEQDYVFNDLKCVRKYYVAMDERGIIIYAFGISVNPEIIWFIAMVLQGRPHDVIQAVSFHPFTEDDGVPAQQTILAKRA